MGISLEGSVITIVNDFIIRKINIQDGISTFHHQIKPYGKWGGDYWNTILWEGSTHPFESAVVINGKPYQAGSFHPINNTTRSGVFNVADHTIENTDIGQKLTVYCRPIDDSVPSVQLELTYEIADDLPVLIRQMRVKNIGKTPVVVDNMVVEMLDRSRYKTAHELHTFSDFYESYGTISYEDDYYRSWIGHSFPKPIRVHLETGEWVESFRLYEYPAADESNDKIVARHRILKKLAPWINNPPISLQLENLTSFEALCQAAKRAEDDGVEMVHFFVTQLFTNTGDYIPRPDLFPNGESDIKRLVDIFHQHGIKVVPYCSLTIAIQPMNGEGGTQVCREHPDWQYLGPDGIRYVSYAHGNMCYQSDWGDYIKKKLNWIIDDLGFDGLHIDGPYHWLPCLEEGHKHKTPESVYYMNWKWEKEFFTEMQAKGKYVSVPQDPAVILFGANARPGGYTEHDFCFMDGLPLINLNRTLLYDARHNQLPAKAVFAFVAVDNYHGHSIQASEEDTTTYNHALASCFALGHWGLIHGSCPYKGPNTKAVFAKWIQFYKQYRSTLNGELIHLIRPDGKHPDALMHVNPDADIPALLMVFNPTGQVAELQLTLPLRYAGFKENSTVTIQHLGNQKLDSGANGVVTLTLEPYAIESFEIN